MSERTRKRVTKTARRKASKPDTLQRRLDEALAREAASAEILASIRSSRESAQPVLDAIVRNLQRLFGTAFAAVSLARDGKVEIAAAAGKARFVAGIRAGGPMRLEDEELLVVRAMRRAEVLRLCPVIGNPDAPPKTERLARKTGFDSIIAAPMLRDGVAIGAIATASAEAVPFDDAQVALIQSFAAQAVIAIENVRLFNETREALEQQIATAEILRVISRSPSDVQPVFDAIAHKASELCNGNHAIVVRFDGELIHLAAQHNARPGAGQPTAQRYPRPPGRETPSSRAVLERAVVHVPYADKDPELPQDFVRRIGAGSFVSVPLLREGRAIGAIGVSRTESGPFPDKQIELVKIFADQAVIAVENARLFNETKEALEQQTASADVLRVIGSSPSDLQPVFDSILENAMRLCEASHATVGLYDGKQYRHVAQRGGSPQYVKFLFDGPFEPNPQYTLGRMIAEHQPFHIADYRELPAYKEGNSRAVATVELGRTRTYLAVPMLKDKVVIGGITLRRTEVRPFTQKQIDLVKTFADQAVIAIENVRLFNETKEALEHQKASTGILRVVSSSIADAAPVFEAIAESCAHIFQSEQIGINLLGEDGAIHLGAYRGRNREQYIEWMRTGPTRQGGKVLNLRRGVAHFPDVENGADVPDPIRQGCRITGSKSIIFAPMISGGRGIGAVFVGRDRVGPFSEKEVALLTTFCEQAVIAIQNARLFNQTQESLERQTATAEILKVIAASPSDTQPVFDAIARSAQQLFAASFAVVVRRVDDTLHLAAHTAMSEAGAESLRKLFPTRLTGEAALGRSVLTGKPAWVTDVETDPAYSEGFREGARERRYRSLLAVPMLREGISIGGIAVTRREPGTFTGHQVELLKTFADQAVIAIENVRLFNETKEALEQQTATSRVLGVISSSPTDVAPVYRTILDNVTRLCEANITALFLYDGEFLRTAAHHNATPEFAKQLDALRVRPSHETPTRRAALERRIVHVEDALNDPSFSLSETHRQENPRTVLSVPLLREDALIGVITVWRRETRLFTDKQVALVRTFADQAAIAIENVRLFNETKEALERQTATAEVLKVIARSPSDTQPVFDALLENAVRLCGAQTGMVFRREGGLMRMVAVHGASPAFVDYVREHNVTLDRRTVTGRTAVEARTVHILDVTQDPEYSYGGQSIEKYRTNLGVPLVRDGEVIGVFTLWRHHVEAFTPREVSLVETFADQAVIAIENVRLFNETKEALEKQTATAEILGVISGTPTDTQPVFEAIVRSATKLCEAVSANVFRYDGDQLHWAATVGWPPDILSAAQSAFPAKPNRSRVAGRVVLEKRAVQVEDIRADAGYDKDLAARLHYRRILGVPLLRWGQVVGVITVGWAEPGPIEPRHEDLLRTFAAQAVIAIENVRLFNETKEALEQQTATAEILRVISSTPTDTQPVFDAIAKSALHIFGGMDVTVGLLDGDAIHIRATTLSYAREALSARIALDRDSCAGRAILDGTEFNIADAEAPGTPPVTRERARLGGWRSIALVPMLREGTSIGHISVLRSQPVALDAKQFALLRTFADQAVIAIENVRLFNETKEALEQQTAISEVLRVISDSPTDVQPVLEAVAARAARICHATDARIFLVDGESVRHVAGFGDVPKTLDAPLTRGSAVGRAVIDRAPVHVDNMQDQSADEYPVGRNIAQQTGWRTVLAVPLLREGRSLGAIVLRRVEVRPFTEKQIALLKTFADQAAIAIENVRLFNETKEALEQQKATAEVLGVISGSIADTQPVFHKILDSCERLFEGHLVGITVVRPDGMLDRAAYRGPHEEEIRSMFPMPLSRDSASGNAILDAKVVHYPEIEAPGVPAGAVQRFRMAGTRAIICAPMLFEGQGVGAIWVGRKFAAAFTDKQIALLRTFADQAAIAIQNAKLFREIQEKSAQLEVANKHKSDFLANMSHELRTPLNAIIGFSEALNDRLFGELNDKQAEYLRDIHESGKHLLSLINDILDLSKIEAGRMELDVSTFDLPSALSNAITLVRERAQRHAIELALQVDKTLGAFSGDERKFKQIMLNLLSNAVKFTPDGGRIAVSARKDTTHVEISVQDTGIGIAPEDQAAVFEEFKQVGRDRLKKAEGTGLGLALTKRFVELHGGAIRLDSTPGKGSTFTVSLPLRTS